MDWQERVPEKYRAHVVGALSWARTLLESGKPVPAGFFVGNTETDELIGVSIDTTSGQGREASAHRARVVAAMHQADFVLSVAEAWALSSNDIHRHEEIYARYGSVAAYPGRVDVLAIQLETHEGLFSLQAPIKGMPPSKKKRTVGELTVLSADAAVGYLANILPAPRAPLH